MSLPSHVEQNRAAWTRYSVDFYAAGKRSWATDEITWGCWAVPEAQVKALGPLEQWQGRDVIELGCGTAYFSSWLARRGAKVVGIDITPAQLANARAFQSEFGIEFPLIEASAEEVPLPDQSFDLAFSEYGASIWCDPYRWIPEAARLLRPGGKLVFLRNTPLSVACQGQLPGITQELQMPWKDVERIQWPDDNSVEFHLPHGDILRLLKSSGFQIDDLIELYATEAQQDLKFGVSAEWARQWPSEEIWCATHV